VEPELTRISYTYLPSLKDLVAVDPKERLNFPPAALVNPTLKVAAAYIDDPMETLLAICDDADHPLKLKGDPDVVFTVKESTNEDPVFITRLEP